MQKNLVLFSIVLFMSHATVGNEPFKIPCLEEARSVQTLMLQEKWSEAKKLMTKLLASCGDSEAIAAIAAFADHLPASVLDEEGGGSPLSMGGIEVGLQFDMAVKAETHWYFRFPEAGTARGIQRARLFYESRRQVLIDSAAEGECPAPVVGSAWTCVSNQDVSQIRPKPGLYRLEVETSQGKLTKEFIISESFFSFDLLLLDSPGTTFRTYYSMKVPYAVSRPSPESDEDVQATEYVFTLYRMNEQEPLKEWRYPAKQFKYRGFIEVPDFGYYRLQFSTRKTKQIGGISFILESVTSRQFYVD